MTLLTSPTGQLEFMYVLNKVMQVKQVNESDTQSPRDNSIKGLHPAVNFIESKGGVSS